MRLGSIRPVVCFCAMLVLAGCSDTDSSAPQASSDSVVTEVRSEKRESQSGEQADLANPLGHSDDAAMLRSTPDYSITPSTETNLKADPGVSLGGGLGGEAALGDASALFNDRELDPSDIEINLSPDDLPAELGSGGFEQQY